MFFPVDELALNFDLFLEKFTVGPFYGLCVIERFALFNDRTAVGTLNPGKSVCLNLRPLTSRSTTPMLPYFSKGLESKRFLGVELLLNSMV